MEKMYNPISKAFAKLEINKHIKYQRNILKDSGIWNKRTEEVLKNYKKKCYEALANINTDNPEEVLEELDKVGEDFIEVIREEQFKRQVKKYLADQNRVTIDLKYTRC